MTTSTPSPRIQRRQSRNREEILDAIERILTAEGFAALRMDAIAEAADVSVGSIYGYFGNKEGAVAAAAGRILLRVEEHMAHAYETGSPLQQVAATGEMFSSLLTEHPFLVRFLMADLPAMAADEPVVVALQDRLRAFHRALADVIDQAVVQGEIRRVDGTLLASFLISAWTGAHALAGTPMLPQDSATATAILDLGSTTLMTGLMPAGTQPD